MISQNHILVLRDSQTFIGFWGSLLERSIIHEIIRVMTAITPLADRAWGAAPAPLRCWSQNLVSIICPVIKLHKPRKRMQCGAIRRSYFFADLLEYLQSLLNNNEKYSEMKSSL